MTNEYRQQGLLVDVWATTLWATTGRPIRICRGPQYGGGYGYGYGYDDYDGYGGGRRRGRGAGFGGGGGSGLPLLGALAGGLLLGDIIVLTLSFLIGLYYQMGSNLL
jgi:hypothetical protein